MRAKSDSTSIVPKVVVFDALGEMRTVQSLDVQERVRGRLAERHVLRVTYFVAFGCSPNSLVFYRNWFLEVFDDCVDNSLVELRRIILEEISEFVHRVPVAFLHDFDFLRIQCSISDVNFNKIVHKCSPTS